MKNYYQILGIEQFSNIEQIKSAFRILAKKFHPDISKDNGEKFIEIFEAYEFLSEKSRKEWYDQNLRGQVHFDSNDIDKDIFQPFFQEFKKKANEFRTLDSEKLRLFLRIVSERIPDLSFAVVLTLIGSALAIGTFYSAENYVGGLLGFLLGFPLAVVGIRDLSIILKIKDFKSATQLFKN